MQSYNEHEKIAEAEEVGKKIWQHLHFKAGIATICVAVLSLSLYYIYQFGPDRATPPNSNVNAGTLKVGVFMPSPSKPGEDIPTNDELKVLDTQVGHHMDIFLWYESSAEDFYTSTFDQMAHDGRTIQLAWEPHDASRGVDQPDYSLKTITAGNHDADIHKWAKELKSFGHEVLFRPMCEMNGNWTTWGVGNAVSGVPPANGNVPTDYIPAWRHIHDIFVQEGATNVKFVWDPNVDGSAAEATYTFNTFYPGDSYVDYIGLNGYNWGTTYNTPDWVSFWQTFEDVFNDSYDTISARTSKPFMIGEMASTELGGNKPNWITDAFSKVVTRFPRIQSLTWFDINKETDWRINSSTASLNAFKQAMIAFTGTATTTTTPPQATDTIAPAVNISAPKDSSHLSSINLTASATDNVGVKQIKIFYDGKLVKSAYSSSITWNRTKRQTSNGVHILEVRAYDTAGNVGKQTFTVYKP